MAQQIGSMFTSLTLEDASFISGMKRAVAETQKANTAINGAMGMAKGAIVGFAGAMSVDAVVELTRKSFDYADAIVDLSDKTGASTKFIQEFGYAAQMSGSGVESARAGLEKFAKKLGEAQAGSKSAQSEMAALGVTSYDLDTAVKQAADGISKLDSRQKQLDATTGLFGKKAGDLTVLLSGGSKAMDELATAAGGLGIVLEDQVLRNAGQVNDKLDQMSMVITAQLANVIVQNADAFVQLANGMIQAGAAAVNFFASMNNQKLLSIVDAKGIGGAMTADVPTVIANRMRGARNGSEQRAMARNDLMGTTSGREALYQRNKRLRGQAAPGSAEAKGLEVERQGILKAELAARRAGRPKPPPRDTRTLNVPTSSVKPKPTPKDSGGGKSAEDLAREAFEKDLAWQNDIDRARGDYLATQQDLNTNAIERFAMEREQLEMDRQRNERDIERDGPKGSKRYTDAQMAELKSLNDQTAYNKADLINRQEEQYLREEKLKLATAGIQNETDLLGTANSNARTAKERRAVELRILDLQFRQEQLTLEAVLANKASTDADKQIAQARLNILGKLRDNQAATITSSTMGPLESYLDSIPQSVEQIDEALQGVAVGGLRDFQDGLVDAVMESKNLGETFGNVAKSIIRGLIQIALQQAIIKPIGDSLFGSSGGGSGGFLGSILGGAKKLLGGALSGSSGTVDANDFLGSVLGGKANGGMGNKGRWLVGERGPEIIEAGGPFNMIPSNKLDGIRGTSGQQNHITIDARGSTDPVAVRALVWEGIAQAAPMLADNAHKTTMKRLNRPGLR